MKEKILEVKVTYRMKGTTTIWFEYQTEEQKHFAHAFIRMLKSENQKVLSTRELYK